MRSANLYKLYYNTDNKSKHNIQWNNEQNRHEKAQHIERLYCAWIIKLII